VCSAIKEKILSGNLPGRTGNQLKALKCHQTLMAYPAQTLEQFKWEKLASSQYLSTPEAKELHWQARQRSPRRASTPQDRGAAEKLPPHGRTLLAGKRRTMGLAARPGAARSSALVVACLALGVCWAAGSTTVSMHHMAPARCAFPARVVPPPTDPAGARCCPAAAGAPCRPGCGVLGVRAYLILPGPEARRARHTA
jgi:hypothetical protein